jgi:hypothetical protein
LRQIAMRAGDDAQTRRRQRAYTVAARFARPYSSPSMSRASTASACPIPPHACQRVAKAKA